MTTFLRPLSTLYGLLARADRSRKLRRMRSFPVPVVSVGGITAGGSGKTPVTRELLVRLQEEFFIILLSRGYGRKGSSPLVWKGGEPQPDPELFGDEPSLLARSMRRGIIGIGPDRSSVLDGILSSMTSFPLPPLVLLDDGFQHARLRRDLDIVIVDDRTADERFLLPAGYLREPFSALGRADILLVTSAKGRGVAEAHAKTGAATFLMRFRPGAPHRPAGEERKNERGEESAESPTEGEKALLVTAIARPERVAASAAEAGFHLLDHRTFRDHHRYSPADAAEILRAAHELGADVVLTTEKDAVKLERFPSLRPLLRILPVEVEIPEAEHLLEIIRRAARNVRQGER